MLKQKSIVSAVAALIAAAPVCFAQTAAPPAPSGTIGTFGPNPGVGPAPIVGSPPSIAIPSVGSQSSFGTTPGSAAGGSSFGGSSIGGSTAPSGTLGTFRANPVVGPAPIVGSPPSISSSPIVTPPAAAHRGLRRAPAASPAR